MTSMGPRQPDLHLAWAMALDRALRLVARRRRVRPDQLGVECECEVSEALAAAIISLAIDARVHHLDWLDVEAVARTELDDVDRFRNAHSPHPTTPSEHPPP